MTFTCQRCGAEPHNLWTFRDPLIPPGDRYHGHGILEVCAGCLYMLSDGNIDRRGQTVGDVLREMNRKRGRQ